MITVWQQPVFNKIFAQNIILLYNREMFPVLHVIFHQLDSYSNMKDFWKDSPLIHTLNQVSKRRLSQNLDDICKDMKNDKLAKGSIVFSVREGSGYNNQDFQTLILQKCFQLLHGRFDFRFVADYSISFEWQVFKVFLKERILLPPHLHYFNFDKMNCFDLNKCGKLESALQSSDLRSKIWSQM